MDAPDPNAPNFMTSFGGGMAGSVVSASLYMIYRLLFQKCRHSKSACHTGWFDCESQEDDPEIVRKETERIEKIIELMRKRGEV